MACILLTQRHYPRTKFLATKIQASQHCSYLAYSLSRSLSLSLSLSLFLTNQLTSHVETESSHFVHASFRAFRAFRILVAFCSCIVSCVSCVYGTWREKPCVRAHRPGALCSWGIKLARKQNLKIAQGPAPPTENNLKTKKNCARVHKSKNARACTTP